MNQALMDAETVAHLAGFIIDYAKSFPLPPTTTKIIPRPSTRHPTSRVPFELTDLTEIM